jgi:hypothetical protein
MAHSFKFIPARPTFAAFFESNDAGAYILNKKAKAAFCAANSCTNNTKVNSQGNLLLLKKSNYLNFYQCSNNISDCLGIGNVRSLTFILVNSSMNQ